MGKPGGSQRTRSERSESGRESGRSKSERGSTRESEKKEEEVDEEKDKVACDIPWQVPLSQFQVERSIYRRSTVWGPLMSTKIGPLALDWQLSLTQGRNEVKVGLYHRTRGIPNLGINYGIYLERKDGSKGKLTSGLRAALASSAVTKTSFTTPRAAQVKRYIHPGDCVRIHAIIRVSCKRFHPSAVVEALIAEERKKGHDYEDGVVGARLWQQVVQGGKTSASGQEGGPRDADIVFQCPGGEEVFAHRAVMTAFSPRFRTTLPGALRKWRLVISSNEVSATALREVLHFIYLRHASLSLYKANLGEVLEAARIFQQPPLPKLEVEKLLILVLDPGNVENLWKLAQVYGLNVLTNMIQTSAKSQPGLKQSLARIRRDLHVSRDIPAEVTQRDASIIA